MINFHPDSMLSSTVQNESSCLQVLQTKAGISLQIDPRTNLNRSILLLDGRSLSSLDFQLTPGPHSLSYELQDNRNRILESAEMVLEAESELDLSEQPVSNSDPLSFEAEEPEKVFTAETFIHAPENGEDAFVFSASDPGKPPEQTQSSQLQVQVPFAPSGDVVWNEPSFDLSVSEVPHGSKLLIRQQDRQEVRPLQTGVQTVELTASKTDVSLLDADGSPVRSWTIQKEKSESSDVKEPQIQKPDDFVGQEDPKPDDAQIKPPSAGGFTPSTDDSPSVDSPLKDPADLAVQGGQTMRPNPSKPVSLPEMFPAQTVLPDSSSDRFRDWEEEKPYESRPMMEPTARAEPALSVSTGIRTPAGQTASAADFKPQTVLNAPTMAASQAQGERAVDIQRPLTALPSKQQEAAASSMTLLAAAEPGNALSDLKQNKESSRSDGIRQALLQTARQPLARAVLKSGDREYRTGNRLYFKDPDQVEIKVQNGSLQKLSVRSQTTEKVYPDLAAAMKSERNTAFDVEASLRSSDGKTAQTARWTVVPTGETVHQKISLSAGEIDAFYALDENGRLTSYQQTRLSAPLLCRGFDPVGRQKLVPGEELRLYVDSAPASWQVSINGKRESGTLQHDELDQPYLPIRVAHGKTALSVYRDGKILCSETLEARNPFSSFPALYGVLGTAAGILLEFRRRRLA